MNMRQIHISIMKPSYHLRISEDLHRFARNLQDMSKELFLLLFLNNSTTKKIFEQILQISCKSVQIFKPLEQYHYK